MPLLARIFLFCIAAVSWGVGTMSDSLAYDGKSTHQKKRYSSKGRSRRKRKRSITLKRSLKLFTLMMVVLLFIFLGGGWAIVNAWKKPISSSGNDTLVQRLKKAHNNSLGKAIAELKAGKKTTHWAWYIFPQWYELSKFYKGKHFGFSSLEEVRKCLANQQLRENFYLIFQTVNQQLQGVERENVRKKLISLMAKELDAQKCCSSATILLLALQEAGAPQESFSELYEQLEVLVRKIGYCQRTVNAFPPSNDFLTTNGLSPVSYI